MNKYSEDRSYLLRITMNNLIEINLSGNMCNTILLERKESNYLFRLDKRSVPGSLLDVRECTVELDGIEHCTGTISECTEDEMFVYLRCSIKGIKN
jgi:hypothetical protein